MAKKREADKVIKLLNSSFSVLFYEMIRSLHSFNYSDKRNNSKSSMFQKSCF